MYIVYTVCIIKVTWLWFSLTYMYICVYVYTWVGGWYVERHLVKAEEREPHFPGGSDSREPACQCRRHISPWIGKIPRRRKWQPSPALCPGELHGQYSCPADYSPWGCEELTGLCHEPTKPPPLWAVPPRESHFFSKTLLSDWICRFPLGRCVFPAWMFLRSQRTWGSS